MDSISNIQITDNVVEMLARKITQLSEKTKEILKTCACIGNRFELENIASALGTSLEEALSSLSEAMKEGFIGYAEGTYKFQHDRIQEAAYSLAEEEERARLHYKIGKAALEESMDGGDPEKKLFYIIDQLNMGHLFIKDSEEKEKLVQMNLEAGVKAKSSSAYSQALQYFETGIGLLETGCWEDNYELTFSLYVNAVESAYLEGDHEKMNKLADIALAHSKSVLDTASVTKPMILASVSTENYEDAIDRAITVMKKLGLKLSGKAGQFDVVMEVIKFKIFLSKSNFDRKLNLPVMEYKKAIISSEVFASMGTAAFYFNPDLLAVGVLKLVRKFEKYGIMDYTALGYTFYAAVLTVMEDFDNAVKFSDFAFRMLEKLNQKRTESQMLFIDSTIVKHWKIPMRETLEPLWNGYLKGLETGNPEYASFNLMEHYAHKLLLGYELSELERNISKAYKIIERMNQKHVLSIHGLSWQTVLNFMGKCDDYTMLQGEGIKAEDLLPEWISSKIQSAIPIYYYAKSYVTFIYGDYELSLEMTKHFDTYKKAQQGVYIIANSLFFQSASLAILYSGFSFPKKLQARLKIGIALKKFKKWGTSSPVSYMQYFKLLQALKAWYVGKDMKKAETLLKDALHVCQKHEDLVLEGQTFKFLAKFYQSIGDSFNAKKYMASAYSSITRWGASGVLDKLRADFPDLVPGSKVPGVSGSSQDSTYMTTTTVTRALDLSTVVKASQAISSEIDIGNLLKNIMTLSLENAGAQQGHLILINEEDKKLYIEASGKSGGNIDVLENQSVEESTNIAETVVNFTHKTGESVVIHDASKDDRFVNDPYIIKNKPKSILCSPIRHKGEIAGIIYLENNIATNAFTSDRIELLQILSSQAAISIENSRLIISRENEAKLKTEMDIAANIQTGLLPKSPHVDGYEITAYMEPADEVGGDYYDVINTGVRDWVVIGDVSGHGVPAGLIMMMVQTTIQALVRKFPDMKPSEVLNVVNEAIKYNVNNLQLDKYMTITVFSIGADGEAMHSGLHQDIYIYRAGTGDVEVIQSTGIWLSPWEMGQVGVDSEIKINSGDVLFLYTDGVTEPRNDKDEMFSEERLIKIVKEKSSLSTEKIRDSVLEEMKGYHTDDDVTMFIMKRQ